MGFLRKLLCAHTLPQHTYIYWLVSFTKIHTQPLTGGRKTFPEGTELAK